MAAAASRVQHLLDSKIKELPVFVLVLGPQVVLDALPPAPHVFRARPCDFIGAKEHDGQSARLWVLTKTGFGCCCCHHLGLLTPLCECLACNDTG